MNRFEHMLRQTNVAMLTDTENTIDFFCNPNWTRARTLANLDDIFRKQMFTASILHIPGKLNIAADVHSCQTHNAASAWLHGETFFTPLLRSIYDKQPKDPEIIKLIAEVESRTATPPEKLPKAHLFMLHGLLERMQKRSSRTRSNRCKSAPRRLLHSK